jgi:PA14 domain-containing protein
MLSLFRIFSFGLVCLLLIASSDAAVNMYGYGSGWSLAAAQSTSVVSVSPGAYQTPDPGQGGLAVNSPSNFGHGNTNAHSSAISDASHNSASDSQTKTCLWPAFQNVSAPKVRITLKFDWAQSGSLEVDAPQRLWRASASSTLRIDYSTNNGGSWTNQVNISHSRLVRDGNSDHVPISDSGSVSVDLPNPGAIDITQFRVRDTIATSVNTFSPIKDFDPTTGSQAVADVTMSISNIRLEVEFVNCIASVPADRWKGEYFNNQTLEGNPVMARDDSLPGTDFLNLNFGNGSPHSLCAPAMDNFSARWTRTVDFAASIYRFSVTGDDGVRLYVDGQLKIDKWFNQGATTYTADVTLSAGAHEVKLEYFESGGLGVAFLSWADVTGVNCLPNTPLPLISSVPQIGGKENIASTAPSQAPKRCGQKNSD